MADIPPSTDAPVLDAHGILLRPWRPGDTDALYEAARESIASVSPWLPWLQESYRREDSAQWIAESSAGRARGDAHIFGIFDDQGRPLGDIGLNRIDTKRGNANLGYWVRTSAQGQGVATRAARAIAAFGFEALGLVRIEIVVAVDNTPSRRTAERLGAHFDGISPNRILLHGEAVPAAVYSLLPPEHDDTSPGPVLEEGTLRLRPFRHTDLPALHASLHESMDSIGRWQSWCTPHFSLEDGRRWIARTRLAWRGVGDQCALVIADRETDELVGSIALNQWQSENGMANVGYWVRQSHQERGIATAALRLLCRHALRATELTRLEIVIASGNAASRRVAEKAGAQFEGIARRRLMLRGEPQDAAIYALVAGDAA